MNDTKYIERGGNFAGVDVGHESICEHGHYKGEEQKNIDLEKDGNPFYSELVTNPELIHFVDLGGNIAWLTNNQDLYNDYKDETPEEQRDIIKCCFIEHPDRKKHEYYCEEAKGKIRSTLSEIIAFWIRW